MAKHNIITTLMITTEQIKQLRDETSISISKCREALEQSEGDMDKARAILREQGASSAEKKAGRELKAGLIVSYIHSNQQMGAILEMNCESDFVAKTEDFITLANNIALHITAMSSPDKESLLAESFVKNPEMTVLQMIEAVTQKTGERIDVGTFSRIAVLG